MPKAIELSIITLKRTNHLLNDTKLQNPL